MPISLDKVIAQRAIIIEQQIIKAEKACIKIDNNFRIFMNSIPPALLDRNVGHLLKTHNHDLNAAIASEQENMLNQININNINSKSKSIDSSNDEKIESKTWDTRMEKSPPKLNAPKRIIKNLKKK